MVWRAAAAGIPPRIAAAASPGTSQLGRSGPAASPEHPGGTAPPRPERSKSAGPAPFHLRGCAAHDTAQRSEDGSPFPILAVTVPRPQSATWILSRTSSDSRKAASHSKRAAKRQCPSGKFAASGPASSPVCRHRDSRNTGLPSLISASQPSPSNPPPQIPDGRTAFSENPCCSEISKQDSYHQKSVISVPDMLLIQLFGK